MKAFIQSLAVASMVLFASSAYAIPIGTVGGIDTILAQTSLSPSNPTTEGAWIASVLGVNVSTINYQQIQNSGASAWQQVTGGASGLWAFDFGAAGITSPLVFLVKYGNAVNTHVLYSNTASFQYGVIDLGAIDPRRGNITITSVSHVGTAGTAQVPEPSSLLFLSGGAFAAASLIRRRKQTN